MRSAAKFPEGLSSGDQWGEEVLVPLSSDMGEKSPAVGRAVQGAPVEVGPL